MGKIQFKDLQTSRKPNKGRRRHREIRHGLSWGCTEELDNWKNLPYFRIWVHKIWRQPRPARWNNVDAIINRLLTKMNTKKDKIQLLRDIEAGLIDPTDIPLIQSFVVRGRNVSRTADASGVNVVLCGQANSPNWLNHMVWPRNNVKCVLIWSEFKTKEAKQKMQIWIGQMERVVWNRTDTSQFQKEAQSVITIFAVLKTKQSQEAE